MSHRLTPAQLSLLASATSGSLSASTLRAHSELRWLEHLGLLGLDGDGRFALTPAGLARLSGEREDSRVDL